MSIFVPTPHYKIVEGIFRVGYSLFSEARLCNIGLLFFFDIFYTSIVFVFVLIAFLCFYYYFIVLLQYFLKCLFDDFYISRSQYVGGKIIFRGEIYSFHIFVDLFDPGRHEPCVIAHIRKIRTYRIKKAVFYFI